MAEKVPNPWITVAYCCLMQAFTIGIGVYSFALFVVPWIEEFSVERGTLMVAITGSSIACALLAPVGGWLMDKYQSKTLILIGQLVFCAGLAAIAYAPSPAIITLLFIALVPVGVTLAGSVMAFSLAARRVKTRRGLAMGITALGTSIGGFVIPFVVTFLLSEYSWRTVYLILAALVMVLVFLPGMFILSADAPAGSLPQQKGPPEVLDFKAIALLGVCFLVPSLLFIGVLHNLGAYALDIGVSQEQAAVVISSCSVLMAVGKLMSGSLSDRVNQFYLYLVVLCGLGLAMLITAGAQNFASLLGGVGLLSFFIGWVAPLIACIVGRRWPVEMFGRVMGLTSAFAGLSGIGSLVRDAVGSYSLAFLGLSSLLVLALVCFLFLSRVRPAGEG